MEEATEKSWLRVRVVDKGRALTDKIQNTDNLYEILCQLSSISIREDEAEGYIRNSHDLALRDKGCQALGTAINGVVDPANSDFVEASGALYLKIMQINRNNRYELRKGMLDDQGCGCHCSLRCACGEGQRGQTHDFVGAARGDVARDRHGRVEARIVLIAVQRRRLNHVAWLQDRDVPDRDR